MTGLTTGQGAALAGGQVGAANALGGAAQNVGNMAYLQSLMQPPAVTPTGVPGLQAPQQGPVIARTLS
jgi:hypothetical protein